MSTDLAPELPRELVLLKDASCMLAEARTIDLEDRGLLPSLPGVYVVSSGDTTLYVGQAQDIRKRWRNHHRLPQLRAFAGPKIRWLIVTSSLRLTIEDRLIKELSPELNRRRIPRKKPKRRGDPLRFDTLDAAFDAVFGSLLRPTRQEGHR